MNKYQHSNLSNKVTPKTEQVLAAEKVERNIANPVILELGVCDYDDQPHRKDQFVIGPRFNNHCKNWRLRTQEEIKNDGMENNETLTRESGSEQESEA